MLHFISSVPFPCSISVWCLFLGDCPLHAVGWATWTALEGTLPFRSLARRCHSTLVLAPFSFYLPIPCGLSRVSFSPRCAALYIAPSLL